MTAPTSASAVSAQTASWADAGGPFKFLDYFTESDAKGFDGRDRDVRAALAGVLKAPSFVLYGGSGTGKTSLLFAGLFPKLRAQGLRPIYVRTLSDPLADLRRAVAAALSDATRPDATRPEAARPEAARPEATPPDSAQTPRSDGLVAALSALSAEGPVVLVFDQFEEFFIRFRQRPDKREPFTEALGALAADRQLGVRMVFSLRQEYLGELDDLRLHLPNLFDNEYRLKPLTAFGARQAIASQLRRAGMPFERRFLTQAVDLLQADNFDPTILQIVCSEIYRRAIVSRSEDESGPGSLRLMARDVNAVGDVRSLFRDYLVKMARSLPRERQLPVRSVLDTLISSEGTRRAATFETLHRESARAEESTIRQILDTLAQFRLVRKDDQGEECWYELSHERVVSVVSEWLEHDTEFRRYRLARRMIASAVRGEGWRRDPESLLTAHQLESVVHRTRRHLRLNDTEVELVLRSAAFRQSRKAAIYWAGRYGGEKSRQLILELLDDRNPAMVLGAAGVARHVHDPEGQLAEACARLAADKDHVEIRAEAYFSVLRLSEKHQQLMREALVESGRQHQELNVLQRLRRFVSFKWRVTRTRRQAARQAFSEPYRSLKTRLLDGLVAALVWSFLIGPVIFLLGAWTAGDPGLISSNNLDQAIGAGAPVVTMVALLAAAGLTTATGLALGRRRSSWRRIASYLLAYLSFVVVVLVMAGVGRRELELLLLRLGSPSITIWLPILASLPLFTVLLIGWQNRVFRLEDPEYKTWGWSLVTSCGLPILLPLIFLYLPAYLLIVFFDMKLDWMERLPATAAALGFALPLSCLCFILQVLLARSGLPPGPEPASDQQRQHARGRAVLILVFNVVGWVATVGIDTIPIWAKTRDVREVTAFEGRLGPGFPDVDYLRIVSNEPTLVRFSEDTVQRIAAQELDLKLDGSGLPAEWSPDHVLVLPGAHPGLAESGRHILTVGPTRSFQSVWEKWQLDFEILDVTGVPASTEDWVYWLIELMPDAPTDTEFPSWNGRLSLTSTPGRFLEVVVFRDQPTTSAIGFKGEVKVETRKEEGISEKWEAAQSPQNCEFANRPILNEPPSVEGRTRRTWRVDANSAGHFELMVWLNLSQPQPRPMRLLLGARLQAEPSSE